MSLRVSLHLPGFDPVTRDIVDGRWAEESPAGRSMVGDGLWALPGLVDGHAHLAAQDDDDWATDSLADAQRRARASLKAGVLLVLDKGWSDWSVVEMIDQVSPSVRPTIETAGRTHAVAEGYMPGFAAEIPPGEIVTAVSRAARRSGGWVKLIGDWPRKGLGPVSNFTEAELKTAVEVATKNGARVAIHTMAREVPSMAVRAGVTSIEHGLFLSEDDLAELGSRDGVWVPTLLRMETVVMQLGADSSGGKLLVEGLENVRRLLPLADEAGVKVLAGTDLAIPTTDVGKEAVRLTEYGLTPEKAMAATSINGYQSTGRGDFFQPGSPADAVLFDEDPAKDPRVLAHPRLVIRLGEVIR